jgi:AraC-like DNA-binding protein
MKVQPGMFTTSPPQCETYVVSRQPFDAINVTVRCGTLANWDAPLADLAVENATTERSVCAGDPSSVDRFKTWVEGLFAAPLPACPDDESALWDAALRTRLRRHLSGIVGRRVSPRTMTSIHRVARYDLVWAALRVIRSETEHRLKVTDLASSVGVSVRALEYAFTSVIGSSPAQYLLAYRLNHARHSLMIQAARGGSVTAVALDHNFENLSRFAQHYSRLFGERPSETLRTARLGFGHA